MGKRFRAEFFTERLAQDPASCNYLLATDFEMETVPGYAATSWAAGYGDYDAARSRDAANGSTAARTALILCDVEDHHSHAELPFAAHHAEAADRPARRDGVRAMMASELEFFPVRAGYAALQAAGYRRADHARAYNEITTSSRPARKRR